MIYYVGDKLLFPAEDITYISFQEAIEKLKVWKRIEVDTETNGRDCHINNVLLIQLGSKEHNAQIVIDVSLNDIRELKGILETKLLILQNGKFDIKFLYNYGIYPRFIYDTMIIEQLLHLGWPSGTYSVSLKNMVHDRLGIDIDKTVRGEIIWRGIDYEVIKYAAGDVMYLEDILESQVKDLNKWGLIKAALLENAFVPVIAYLEWCGIKLDEDKWKAKMKDDQNNVLTREKALNNFVLRLSEEGYETKDMILSKHRFKKFIFVDGQGNLFTGFDLTPKCTIKWSSSKQVIEFAKLLGFDTKVQDKETGEDKDSVLEKHLKKQKGVCDEFLELYFDYQEARKRCTTYGQSYLNAINPKTGRIHTEFRQLGTDSGRLACGSKQVNTDLAKLKGLPLKRQNDTTKHCGYPQLQNLPSDEITRSCFVCESENVFCSCDWSAIESRLGADIYNEPAMIREYLEGSGDMHSLVAKKCFPKELEGIEVKDIKKLRPDLRKKAKGPEFAMQFGGSPFAIANSLSCSLSEAEEIADAYWQGFPGIAEFKKRGSRFVRQNGYVVMCKYTGHKMFWYGHDSWLAQQKSFTPEFWEDYREHHKGTKDSIARMVSEHAKTGSYWDRMSLNSVTQGTGAVCLKDACVVLFKYILDNDLFGKVLICDLVHDEICIEYPKELEYMGIKLEEIMENSASKYCKALPIPAEKEVSDHWIH